MVQIKSLREELKSLGLLTESVQAPAPTEPAPKADGKKVMERKQDARKMRTRIESLTKTYSTKAVKKVEESKKDPKSRIKKLMEELEDLTGEPTEPEGDKAARIMKDVQEIAGAVMKKYGDHDEVKEVFGALGEAAEALTRRMAEAEMPEPEAEKEVKKVVAELVDALEWLLEEFEPVEPGALNYGKPGDPDAPEQHGGEGSTEPLPAQPGAGAPVAESRRK